jgi:uncharacterized membrane protein
MAMLMVLAVLGFLVSVAGVAGVWFVRAPANSAVTDVADTMTYALGIVDNGLARVMTRCKTHGKRSRR